MKSEMLRCIPAAFEGDYDDGMTASSSEWHLRLFSKSVSKQAKWRAIRQMLEDLRPSCGLDLGSDNGIISFLLRREGGGWYSADLDRTTVHSIRSTVGSRVFQTDGERLPLPDASLDVVVVVDMLEHVRAHESLIGEIHRVLKPGGRVVINVPHVKRFSLLRPLRQALGLTDEWHGHVRPGYTLRDLCDLFAGRFTVNAWHTYDRFFSELLDIALNYTYHRRSKKAAGGGSKGTVLTESDMARHEKTFRLYARLYPFMVLWTRLDLLARPFPGYRLIVSADKTRET